MDQPEVRHPQSRAPEYEFGSGLSAASGCQSAIHPTNAERCQCNDASVSRIGDRGNAELFSEMPEVPDRPPRSTVSGRTANPSDSGFDCPHASLRRYRLRPWRVFQFGTCDPSVEMVPLSEVPV